MNKIKLAICMKDLEYQGRFVNCFMNHYKHLYELHVFTQVEQLKEAVACTYAVVITGEYTTEERMDFVEKGEKLLILTEDYVEQTDALETNTVYTEKYQEVYKIAEIIDCLTADKVSVNRGITEKKYEKIGIYSLTQAEYQIPFAALLGKIYGEQQKVLVVNLQAYSGLNKKDEVSMGLEDLMSVVMTGNYSRSRILECIRHEPNWDYIYAVQNNQCLAEGTKELYDELIELLAKEMGYQKIIINFGSVFIGQLDMMEECRSLFLLVKKGEDKRWREGDFYKELNRQEREGLIHKIKKFEIPEIPIRESDWEVLVEKWSWGTLGELLRGIQVKEKGNGTAL